MKKIFLLCLAMCLLLSLVACDDESLPEQGREPEQGEETEQPEQEQKPEQAHTHSFQEAWVFDEYDHWRACEDASCIEVAEKAAHQWVDNGIVQEATPENDGLAEQACSVCGAKQSNPVPYTGMETEAWQEMLSPPQFENYTFSTEGVMTVTQNGIHQATSYVKSVTKFTADKLELLLYAMDTGSEAEDVESMVFEGEIAEVQKIQYSQVFMTLLAERDHFTYDPQTKTYKVTECITIETLLKAIVMKNGIEPSLMDMPTKMEMREAEATISDDGRLLKFVCDYTQTMTMPEGELVTAGITTGVFYDYGTTVIE